MDTVAAMKMRRVGERWIKMGILSLGGGNGVGRCSGKKRGEGED